MIIAHIFCSVWYLVLSGIKISIEIPKIYIHPVIGDHLHSLTESWATITHDHECKGHTNLSHIHSWSAMIVNDRRSHSDHPIIAFFVNCLIVLQIQYFLGFHVSALFLNFALSMNWSCHICIRCSMIFFSIRLYLNLTFIFYMLST